MLPPKRGAASPAPARAALHRQIVRTCSTVSPTWRSRFTTDTKQIESYPQPHPVSRSALFFFLQLRHRETHMTTCLTTLHCLLSELEEIFRVRGVVASTSDTRTGDGESVIERVCLRAACPTHNTEARAGHADSMTCASPSSSPISGGSCRRSHTDTTAP